MTESTTISLDDSTQHFVTEVEVVKPDYDFSTTEEAVIDTGAYDALSVPEDMKDDFPGPKFDFRGGKGTKCTYVQLKSVNGVEISHRCIIVFDLPPRDPVLIGLEFLLNTDFEVKGSPDNKRLELKFEHID